MKNILSKTLLFTAGVLSLASCSDDLDSNPTLIQPTEFMLNTPAIVNGTVDLSLTTGVELSWSQPKYTEDNAPVVVTYYVQVSSTGSFNKEYNTSAKDDSENDGADFITLDETTTACKMSVAGTSLAKALQQLNKWEEGAVPATVEMSIRMKSAVLDAGLVPHNDIASNVVKLTAIPYYYELKDADPVTWYLIGGDIGDGKWTDDIPVSLFPLQPQKDYEFDKKTGDGELTWTGYVAGNGFKLKKGPGDWDHQWGMNNGSLVENDGGSGNITCADGPGYYTVTLNTGKHELSVTAYDGTPTVYPQMLVSGSFNSWATDQQMSPVHVFDGAVNHDWYTTLTLEAGAEVKFLSDASCSSNWGAVPTRILTDGLYGYGENNGANIVVPEAGTYIVILNDITGYYRFIKQ